MTTLPIESAQYRTKLPRTCSECHKKSQNIAVGSSYVLTHWHLICRIEREDKKHHPCKAVTATYHPECWEARNEN